VTIPTVGSCGVFVPCDSSITSDAHDRLDDFVRRVDRMVYKIAEEAAKDRLAIETGAVLEVCDVDMAIVLVIKAFEQFKMRE